MCRTVSGCGAIKSRYCLNRKKQPLVVPKQKYIAKLKKKYVLKYKLYTVEVILYAGF